MGSVGIGVAKGVLPVSGDSMLLQPGFAVALGLLMFGGSEAGGIGNAPFDTFGNASPHGLSARVSGAPMELLGIEAQVLVNVVANVGVDCFSGFTSCSLVIVVNVSSGEAIDSTRNRLIQVEGLNVPGDRDRFVVWLENDLESGMDGEMPGPVNVEGTYHWEHLGVSDEEVPAGGVFFAVGCTAGGQVGCAAPEMRLATDVGPASFEHACKSRDVLNVRIDIPSESRGQRRKEAEISKSSEH